MLGGGAAVDGGLVVGGGLVEGGEAVVGRGLVVGEELVVGGETVVDGGPVVDGGASASVSPPPQAAARIATAETADKSHVCDLRFWMLSSYCEEIASSR